MYFSYLWLKINSISVSAQLCCSRFTDSSSLKRFCRYFVVKSKDGGDAAMLIAKDYCARQIKAAGGMEVAEIEKTTLFLSAGLQRYVCNML